MLNRYYIICAIIAEAITVAAGSRPYELDWAGRDKDDHPALVDFENLDGWTVENSESVASFSRSDEQRIWGNYVGKIVYRADGKNPSFMIKPPAPLKTANNFDALSLWIYGNNFLARDKTTPSVHIYACFVGGSGKPFDVRLINTRWEQWFLCHRRLSTEQINRVKNGGTKFAGFRITGGRNKEDRVLYFDSFCLFKEEFKKLSFNPRAKRGVQVFNGRDHGINTGEGILPFPNRTKTIVPQSVTSAKPIVKRVGDTLQMSVKGGLTAEVPLRSCQWDGLRIRSCDSAKWIYPSEGGGIFFAGDDDVPRSPDSVDLIDVAIKESRATCRWKASLKKTNCTVVMTWWLEGQSLVADIAVEGGAVKEVRFGRVKGLDKPRLVTLPYYTYGTQNRPATAVGGDSENPLFLAQHVDWTLSNASTPFAVNDVQDDAVVINGGTRYTSKTNGERNSCYERFVFSLRSKFDAVLPTIPNPVSPWKHVTGRGIWRAHGASNRDNDVAFWHDMHRHGLRELIVTDHETGWRDEHESFTFRTKTAPGKGGDKGQYDYARIMQDELSYVYGPYNNFTDFAPVNEFWSSDMISRLPDNQLQHAWARCYAPKPLRAVEYCEKLAPVIEKKFHFSTAYCDVHTAVTPWSRTDYDWRVPGAGTFTQTFYAYGEIMLLQKAAWEGPVYSEGNNHFPYCGLTDGNYAQDQRYNLMENPWLVDFDLCRMHDLCCNFGVGNVGMFFGQNADLGSSPAEIRSSLDRFLAATLAFGHPGFLLRSGGIESSMRSYYMLQQIQERYTQASAVKILYFNGRKLLDTSAAVASGAYRRSQVVVEYEGGVNVMVNGSRTQAFNCKWKNRSIALPPNGYAAWTDDDEIEVFSGLHEGHRIDYCRSPKYIYIDGRGEFSRYKRGASAGVSVCRFLRDGQMEVIPLDNLECGFAVQAESAVAFDKAGKTIGSVQLRYSRGLTYIVPVDGAFSYRLAPGKNKKLPESLACEVMKVVPGQKIEISKGDKLHKFQIPPDAVVGNRTWKQIGDLWIDFIVTPLCGIDADVSDNVLKVIFTPNLSAQNGFMKIGNREFEFQMFEGESRLFEIPVKQQGAEHIKRYALNIEAENFKQNQNLVVSADYRYLNLGTLPAQGKKGMRLKAKTIEEPIRDDSGARVSNYPEMTCGEVTRKKVLFMHPPYKNGSGYTYVEYKRFVLPEQPAVLRAFVGKGNDSDLGDGIFFRVEVGVDGNFTVAGSAHVASHEWRRIEADLGAWTGKTIDVRLVTDCGKNTAGDWGGWSDIRFETPEKEFVWDLLPDADKNLQASPHPVSGLTKALLQKAKKGVIRYEAIGLAGRHPVYGSFGLFNGLELGNMIPAGGNEQKNVWSKPVELKLSAEALKSLQMHNIFEVYNPGNDCFKLRNICLELELADGRKAASLIHSGVITQPGSWLYAEGAGVPPGSNIKVDLWFSDEF